MENNEELPVIEFENPQEPDIEYVGTEVVVEEKKEELPVIQLGRPSDYTPEKAEEICKIISLGNSLRSICRQEDMPDQTTVFRWLREREDFRLQYEAACEERVESQHEMIADIGDEAIIHAEEADPKAAGAVVSAYKLKADNLKWSMSKMKPKKYGDKLDVTSDGKAIKGNALIIQEFGGNEADSK